MNFIEATARNPITVVVVVTLAMIAGVLAFTSVPVQMTPNVDSVVISVTTRWENASPKEVESDITGEQERVLGDVSGLVAMTSISSAGQSQLRLEFENGIDIDLALRQVLQKLDEVPFYPLGVTQPVVDAVDPDSVDYIAWIGLASTDPNFDATTLYDFMERRLRPRFEALKGVSQVGIVGARDRELQIQVDPHAMAALGVTYSDLTNAIRVSNQNFSGGLLEDGKNDIRVRAVGRFSDPSVVERMVIRRDGSGAPTYLGDVAKVVIGYKEMQSWVRSRGITMPFFNFQLQYGANLLETMDLIKAEVQTLNEPGGFLQQEANRLGIDGTLELVQPWDSSTYVDSAIELVRSNILIGGILAIAALLFFLRSVRTIGVVAIAIPISVVSSVVVLVALGRSVNIVSLAGMAFAIGMVIDNSIVVIENIFRHLEKGKKPLRAAVDGTKEVSGAVLASTITTLVVFLPILFIQDSAGQLFRDISLAIMASVGISMLVSVFVIPAAAAALLKQKNKQSISKENKKTLADYIASFVAWIIRSIKMRIAVIALFSVGTLVGIVMLVPPMDYLPKGNRNGVFAVMIPPPGYNLDQMLEIGKRAEDIVRPNWEYTGDKFGAEARIRGTEFPDPEDRRPPLTLPSGETIQSPALDHHFVVAFNGMMFQGALPNDPNKTVDAVDFINMATAGETAPDVISFAFQFPLFVNGGTTGSAINIDLVGADLEQVSGAAAGLMFSLIGDFGPYAVVPEPANFLLPSPELRITADDERLQQLGMSRGDLGMAVAVNGDGMLIPRAFEIGGELKDIKIISENSFGLSPIDAMLEAPLATRTGDVVDVRNIATVERIRDADQIKHVNRQRAVTLQFTPPPGMPMENAINAVNAKVEELRNFGAIPQSVEVQLAGSAGKLKDIQQALMGDGTIRGVVTSSLFLALVVVYLVMVVLFRNWFYPLVIMVTVPLATLGGFAGLAGVHWASVMDRYMPVQNLDVLTILGFVILAGVVVNNAILIVHQSLNFLKGVDENGNPLPANRLLTPDQAIVESVRSRVRPILMGTLTSVGGMLPLVLMPGAGSELYRGLGSVVVGGLMVSTIFTLILVPVILSVIFKFSKPEVNKLDNEDDIDSGVLAAK